MENAHKLSLTLVDQCRVDVDAFCKLPSMYRFGIFKDQVDSKGKAKFLSLLLMQDYKDCAEHVIPNPFFSLISPFMYSSSCPIPHMIVSQPDTLNEKKEVMADVIALSVQQIFNDYRIAQNPQGSSRYEFALQGRPHVNSRFISTLSVRSRAMLVFLSYLFEVLIAVSFANEKAGLLDGKLILLPEQVHVPVGEFSIEELRTMIHEAVLSSPEGRSQTNEVVDILDQVLDQAVAKVGMEPKSLNPLPEFPFSVGGVEKSECIRQLYRSDMLLSQSCRRALDAAAEKMEEMEFQWDMPVADIVLWLYIALSCMALSGLQRRLMAGETQRQRGKRHLIQTLKDPVLRRSMELEIIEDRGEEHVAKLMADMDAQAASFEAEFQADEDWKKREGLNQAWTQRLQYLLRIRLGGIGLCGISLCLLWIDHPKAGRVLDGIEVLLLGLCCTYACLPSSPHSKSKKMAESKVPLLSDP